MGIVMLSDQENFDLVILNQRIHSLLSRVSFTH